MFLLLVFVLVLRVCHFLSLCLFPNSDSFSLVGHFWRYLCHHDVLGKKSGLLLCLSSRRVTCSPVCLSCFLCCLSASIFSFFVFGSSSCFSTSCSGLISSSSDSELFFLCCYFQFFAFFFSFFCWRCKINCFSDLRAGFCLVCSLLVDGSLSLIGSG